MTDFIFLLCGVALEPAQKRLYNACNMTFAYSIKKSSIQQRENVQMLRTNEWGECTVISCVLTQKGKSLQREAQMSTVDLENDMVCIGQNKTRK